MSHRVRVVRCPCCDAWTPKNAPTCIACGEDIDDDDDDALFDADELGLDPEVDEYRAYGDIVSEYYRGGGV